MTDVRAQLVRVTGFQWDAGNDTKNWTKHAVTHSECEQAFLNAPLVVADDPVHSRLELRHFALGRTDDERLLFLVFTLRGTSIRVISARPMSRHERTVYLHAEAKEEEAE